MKRASVALAVASGLALFSVPVLTLAMGSGGMGGGGMPSGGGGMNSMPSGPQYDPQIEYQHGTADLQAGKYKDAASDFEHVTEAAPKSANAWLMLGEAREGAGDEKGAQKAYERSVKLDGTSVQAHRELALSEIKLNQMDKAHAELADLQTMAAKCGDGCPDAADLKAAIGAIQAAMPGGATPAPAASNDAATHLSVATPQAGDGAYVRAVSLINERRWDEALASLDKAEAALGPHPDILTYKGYVWRRKGDWGRAEDFYRQALAIDPDHRGATEYYGELKVLKGDMAGAKAMLSRLDAVCTFGCAEAVELRLWIDHGGDPAA
ncbi:MAG TPA: tetratricopeptide repeat protein [Caulobacteraceae bacterium]|nr:tetratricopeptide repeat protein [Caulobacteraceae bacterium]